jgi:multiple sugar transport system permease protein
MENMKRRSRSSLYLFLTPALLYLFTWRIVPLFYTAYLSFTDWNLLKGVSTTWVGLQNYKYLLTEPTFFHSVKTTFLFMVVSTLSEVVLGIGIAVLLDRKMRGIDIVRGICLVPMLVTPVVVGSIWYILFHSQIGPINYLLTIFGISPVHWLDSTKNALYAIVIADIWQWTPFVVLLVLAGLQTVPLELYEAGKIDGASTIELFRYITLPSIKNVVLIVAVLRAMDAFRVFDTVFIMTGGGPSNATEVASVRVFKTAFQFFNLGSASAMVILLIIMMSLLAGIYIKSVRI